MEHQIKLWAFQLGTGRNYFDRHPYLSREVGKKLLEDQHRLARLVEVSVTAFVADFEGLFEEFETFQGDSAG